MGIVTLVILIFLLPYVWFLWTGISNKTGMMERYRWKKPLATLLLLVIISAALNCFYSNAYQLAFFQNGFELMVGLIVAGAFLVILSIINIIVGIVYKNAPKSFHNPKVAWTVSMFLCATILFFIVWVYPLAEKASYITQLESAIAAANEQQDGEEITVVFMSSEKQCVRRRTENCNSSDYQNAFFVQNNLDETKQVQVQIRALDHEQNELKSVESKIMTLQAGELKLVETEETSDQESIWSRSSFETEVRTASYQSIYRYRDAN